jgi:hypothetical protein
MKILSDEVLNANTVQSKIDALGSYFDDKVNTAENDLNDKINAVQNELEQVAQTVCELQDDMNKIQFIQKCCIIGFGWLIIAAVLVYNNVSFI